MSISQEKSFSVHLNHKSDSAILKAPKIIGYWSLDRNKQIHWDSSQLRYYTPFKQANVEYDLKVGSSIFERDSDSLDDEKCDHILRWIQKNYEKILDDSESDKWLQPDFIFYRGILARIIKTPYIHAFGWIICAVKFKGTIYFCPFDTEQEKVRRENGSQDFKEKWTWGFKFKQYMLTGAPGQAPDTSKAVNESEKFCGVFQSCLNDHNLVYAAKLDALYSDEKVEDPLPLDELKFVELKTWDGAPTGQRKYNWNKFSSLAWWTQSYLVGIENIVCGLRSIEEGIVRRLETKKVSDLPGKFENHWSPTVCMNFGNEFLNFVKVTVKKDYDETIYKFEKKPRGDIVVTELEPTSDYAFLPEWYTQLAGQ